jgi:hypothetical protein
MGTVLALIELSLKAAKTGADRAKQLTDPMTKEH